MKLRGTDQQKQFQIVLVLVKVTIPFQSLRDMRK